MAYIGRPSIVGNFVKLDAITAVNGQAAYTMQNGSVNFADYSTVNQFLVSLNGTIQSPGSSFTVSGSTLTFASNLSTGDVIDFIMVCGNSLSAGTPTDATVSTAKIVDDAVTAAKINNDIISGSTELASEPADTDEFLVSDAGTLKRIDYSLIKATSGLAVADMWRLTSDYSFGTGDNVVTSNWEQIDTGGQNTVGSNMTESSGLFTFPSTGVWLVMACAGFVLNGGARYIGIKISATFNGGSSYATLSQKYTHINRPGSSNTYAAATTSTYVNVGNTSNDKVRFLVEGETTINLKGSTSQNESEFLFIKLN